MSEPNDLTANEDTADTTDASPAAESTKPEAIHKMNRTASGVSVSAGYYVVGPSGQLVLQRPDQPVKGGWRLATQRDIDEKEQLEHERRRADKSGEHEERSKLAAAATAKKAWVEGRSTRLTL